MKLFLHEIKEIETELEFTHDEKWVAEAVSRCDEVSETDGTRPGLRIRPIHCQMNFRKVDEVVVASGQVQTQIQLVCSRCANPFSFHAAPKFSALFCNDPEMAGVAHLARNPDRWQAPGKPRGQNHGFARHAHDEKRSNQEEFGKDLDITYISEDFINLADVVTEQLQLQIPFQPLCKEDCKGICPRCGTDQNVARCACAKIVKESPFAVLKGFKT